MLTGRGLPVRKGIDGGVQPRQQHDVSAFQRRLQGRTWQEQVAALNQDDGGRPPPCSSICARDLPTAWSGTSSRATLLGGVRFM